MDWTDKHLGALVSEATRDFAWLLGTIVAGVGILLLVMVGFFGLLAWIDKWHGED